jgi:hypothetical protein
LKSLRLAVADIAAHFIWVRCRSAYGSGHSTDPQAQIVFDTVGVAHLEIVAQHPLSREEAGLSIGALSRRYPAPVVERL